MPKRPRGNGVSARIIDLLVDMPRPLFLGEIVALLDFAYEAAEVASALVKLEREKKVQASLQPRRGPGRHMAKAYAVPNLAMWESAPDEPGEFRHICQTPK